MLILPHVHDKAAPEQNVMVSNTFGCFNPWYLCVTRLGHFDGLPYEMKLNANGLVFAMDGSNANILNDKNVKENCKFLFATRDGYEDVSRKDHHGRRGFQSGIAVDDSFCLFVWMCVICTLPPTIVKRCPASRYVNCCAPFVGTPHLPFAQWCCVISASLASIGTENILLNWCRSLFWLSLALSLLQDAAFLLFEGSVLGTVVLFRSNVLWRLCLTWEQNICFGFGVFWFSDIIIVQSNLNVEKNNGGNL